MIPVHQHHHGFEAHDHSHGDEPHDHPPGEELNAYAGQGPVIVDVGGEVGALVLYTEPDMAGVEIEISPTELDDKRHHVAVLPRTFGDRTAHAAVYPGLKEGTYRLWQPDGQPTKAVTITGGHITELKWLDIAGG